MLTKTEIADIPRAEWASFFDGFSRQHAGWRTTVELLDRAFGVYPEAGALPLVGITAEPEAGLIFVSLGKTPDDHVTHTIVAPVRVLYERCEDDGGGAEVVLVEAGDGNKTMIHFASRVLPEMVDGLA